MLKKSNHIEENQKVGRGVKKILNSVNVRNLCDEKIILFLELF